LILEALISAIERISPMIITYLEMRSPEQLRPRRCAEGRLQIRGRTEGDWRFNRDLYFAVGADWAWTDKRSWSDEQWQEYALAPELRSFGGYCYETLAGYYELHRDTDGGVEIAYFGLLPAFIGEGLGGALLTDAIERAWLMTPAVNRVWVHTCTRDHPRALANYQARGMVICQVEEKPE
jgi:GNAT superfamily N-acetyltransferase